MQKSLHSELFRNFPHEVIHNCINADQFKMIGKPEARQALNIDADRIVFCFVSDYVNNYRKGYAELKQAFSMIHNRDIEVISVGADGAVAWPLSIRHRHFGRLNSEELQLVYSASDAFVFPTKEEALGNVMLEAMACGTPVIGTPVGGLLDVIKEGFNGVFAEDCFAAAIKKAVLRFIDVKESFNRSKIREDIVKEFSEEKVAKAYLNVYNNILDRNFTPE
jgi:glycosyltransferase involved in cell wall biosynthesis